MQLPMHLTSLVPLLLLPLSAASEDVCPAGYSPVIVYETVQYTLTTTAAVSAFGTSVLETSLTGAVAVSESSRQTSEVSFSSTSVSPITTIPNASASPVSISSTSVSPVTTTAISSAILKSTSSSSSVSTTSLVSSTSATPGSQFIGIGTRYGGDCTEEDCWQSGACSFTDYTLPAGIDGSTCVSADIWNNGGNCGGCISVTYEGKTITVMVTNETGGNATHLDMTPDTFSKLTNGYSGGGVDPIGWEWITCPFSEPAPLSIVMHDGASKYWFAATVENATLRTDKLEVSSDNGQTWQETTRQTYNMYVLSSTLPDDTAWVRVTSVSGSQVVVEDVVLASGRSTVATENY